MNQKTNQYCEIIKERVRYLQNVVREKEMAVQTAEKRNPAIAGETVRVKQNRGEYQYYLRVRPDDTCGTYMKKKELKKASQIIQFGYDKKVLNLAKQELLLLERYLKGDFAKKVDDLYSRAADARRMLIWPIELSDQEYVDRWMAVEYEGKIFYNTVEELTTERGEQVRSKSELIIANLLNKHEVPYRYEYPLQIKEWGIIYPDFTILDIKTRTEVIWEHFGMMDDENYRNQAFDKMARYEMSGRREGENLIYTFETLQHPLNVKLVEQKIKNFIS